MKKNFSAFITAVLTLAFIIALVGCGCSQNGDTPKGTQTSAPTDTDGTDILSELPDIINTLIPSDIPTPSSSVAPEGSTGADGSESPEESGGIEDFAEGRVVKPEDVPNITAAVTAKYPKAQIQSITEVLHLDEQCYEVIFTNTDGQQITVYVSADGQTITESQNPMATQS